MVAEMSGNHNQSFEKAMEIVRAAKEAGADAVKLQTYTPDTITLNSRKPWFMKSDKEDTPEDWKGKSLYELYETAHTSWDWQPKLKAYADELGILLFSTPFDETAVDFLDKEVGVSCFKVASYEATHIPLLKKIAATGKPVILSIGFASVEEIELAVSTLKESGAADIAVLHCVTGYSATPKPEEMNLQTIRDIRERFGVVSGFSDNNAGVDIPVAAILKGGASILEKHITLSRADRGIDSIFSLEPDEFAELVRRVRLAERAIGSVHYGTASLAEEENKRARQSVWVKAEMKKGDVFTKENTVVRRPEAGLMPKHYEEILGKRAARDIEATTPVTWELVE